MTMKETFTYEELIKILNNALEKSVQKIGDNDSEISKVMDKAWNRGATSMFNHVLLEMYEVMEAQ